jgi:hypothetical protein
MGYRTCNDLIPEGERAFILASTMIAQEEGERPIQVRDFSKKKE